MDPLKFTPILKRARWGGRRLGELLGKSIGPFSDYAESWEVCDHGAEQSVVETGPLKNCNLSRLVRDRPDELLGRHRGLSQFPLLLKFLDARDRLSVQVHPDDVQASLFSPGERGKTEAWVVVHADAGSCVYAGLNRGIDEADVREAIGNGTLEQCLHRVEVAAGDCLFIPAGTIHAIGEGIVLVEVQQSSDLTFRLFDWNRVEADGNPRPLHIEQSLGCTDFVRGPVDKVIPKIVPPTGHDVELLVTCPYFTIHRHVFAERRMIPDDDRCHIVVGLGGRSTCRGGNGEQPLAAGETVLVPASALPVELLPVGAAVVLDVFWD